MESCVFVRGKEVESGRILWKGSFLINDWDHNVEGDAVVCVGREEVLQALSENRKAPGPTEVSLELIAASVGGGVGIQVMAEICQEILKDLECQLNGL